MKYSIILTGAGSVMGQSIFRALALSSVAKDLEVVVTNSEELGAARFFSDDRLRIVDTPLVPIASDAAYPGTIRNLIEKHGSCLVYPGTQHELAALSKMRDEGVPVASLAASTASLCMDKLRLAEFLDQRSIRGPATTSLDDFLGAQRSEPAIIKPRTSSASRWIFRYDPKDQAAFDGYLAAIPNRDFVVQELLRGVEYTCGCYLDKYNKMTSVIVLERTLTPDGATGYGKVVRSEKIENYVLATANALRDAGFDFGHINVQLMDTAEGPQLFEINGRLSSTEGPKAMMGFNSVEAFFHNVVLAKPYTRFAPLVGQRFLRYYEEVYF